MDKILAITVYLKDMLDYATFNEIYKEFFSGDLPARTCIQAGDLPFETSVEVTATAFI